MPNVLNDAGETVFRGQSDAECVRWWQDEGLDTDWLSDTGELMLEVEANLGLER